MGLEPISLASANAIARLNFFRPRYSGDGDLTLVSSAFTNSAIRQYKGTKTFSKYQIFSLKNFAARGGLEPP